MHENTEAAAEIGADLEYVRERLHVVDTDGTTRVGAEAFAALWAITPRQGWRATAVGLPGVRALSRGLYNLFARGLYRWNRRRGHW